jgi:NAD(P)-dependent dehydrogenase (short-subunit alcohol dehydrogenase family)
MEIKMAGWFQGKVALVTGCSSGIGRATVMAIAREGAKVIIADKNVKGGDETVRRVKQVVCEATFVKIDVSKTAEVEELVNKTIETYGGLDCAFNYAGISGSGVSAVDCTEESWDHTINANLKSMWLCLKYEILWMHKHGGVAIVNTSSAVGLKGTPDDTDYNVSKTGVVGLTKSAALAYAKSGIRINVVCPGMIDIPMIKQKGESLFLTRYERTKQAVLSGRIGVPEEIAEAVIWLCSDSASYITGITMPVDGGILAK